MQDNQSNFGGNINTINSRVGSKLEVIFGSTAKIKNMGAIYQANQEDFDMMASYLLNKFNIEQEYTSKENTFYRKAQSDILKLFKECYDYSLLQN